MKPRNDYTIKDVKKEVKDELYEALMRAIDRYREELSSGAPKAVLELERANLNNLAEQYNSRI